LLPSTDFESKKVEGCDCQPIPQILLSDGLFPTTPSQPHFAVSVDLLDFYQALFKQSCDSVQALASMLSTFYMRRGFPMLNKHGEPIQDAFWRGLGYAIQWYDCLKLWVQHKVDAAVEASDQQIQVVANTTAGPECDQILVQQCPACFAGQLFGHALD
jgi:hypothetical protein